MSMNKDLKEYIMAVGALAEAMALFRDNLLKHGFSRVETLEMIKVYLNNITKTHKEDNNNG